MTPETLQQVRSIVENAIAQPDEKRAGYVDAACVDNPSLRDQVEQLLQSVGHLGEFLEVPDSPSVDKTQSDVVAGEPVGRRVGPYRLMHVLACGGMGTVFYAIRADDIFEQQVAIKLINRGMESDDVLRRFHQERQLLASLAHPNIARLLDGGTTDDGRPYLVMEYIDGQPIDAYCDRHQLSIRDRIELFGQICSAVQYAHQNLIIHRDLKPGNILVTTSGMPKLVDFGISKLVEDNPERSHSSTTVAAALTPQYASPEQIRGERVTTMTDVYSLGVVLYEILTGCRPYQLEDVAGYEMERIICESAPHKPSSVILRAYVGRNGAIDPNQGTLAKLDTLRGVRPEQLRTSLSGDLDTIILRAMAKDPNRRYPSVELFDEDLHRYLAGMPVRARPDTFSYRAQKFIRRNRTMMTAVAAVFLIMVTATAVSTAMFLRMRQAKELAHQEKKAALVSQQHAQEVAYFLQEVLQAANPYRKGREVSLLELLADAEARIEAELAGQPVIEADVRFALATTYYGLWYHSKAREHLAIAVDLNRRYRTSDHPALADSLALLGRAWAHDRNPKCVNAEKKALALYEEIYGSEHRLVACANGWLAFAYWFSGDPANFAKVELTYRKSLGMLEQMRTGPDYDEAVLRYSFGAFLETQGRLEEAEPFYVDALDIFRKCPHKRDRYVAECLNAYARALERTDRPAQAVQLLEEYLDMVPQEHWGSRTYDATLRLGRIQFSLDNLTAADQAYRQWLMHSLQAIAGTERDVNTEASLETRTQASRLYDAVTASLKQDLDFGTCLRAFHILGGDEKSSAHLVSQFLTIAQIQFELNRRDQAIQFLRLLRNEINRQHGGQTWCKLAATWVLGDCLREHGAVDEAEKLLIDGLGHATQHLPPTHGLTVQYRDSLASLNEYKEGRSRAAKPKPQSPDSP